MCLLASERERRIDAYRAPRRASRGDGGGDDQRRHDQRERYRIPRLDPEEQCGQEWSISIPRSRGPSGGSEEPPLPGEANLASLR